MSMQHHVMEMDWKGKEDKKVDEIKSGVIIEDYMDENGYKRVKGSPVLFKKGRRVRYVAYGDMELSEIKPKLNDYFSTYKI